MTMPLLADRQPHNAPAVRHPRASVMLNAVVEHFGGKAPTRHRVRDLAPGGIRIDQADDLRVGASVVISVGALEAVGATIVWVAAGSAGLAFAESIDPELARTRTAVAPRSAARQTAVQPGVPRPIADARPVGTTAGWITELRSPYRR